MSDATASTPRYERKREAILAAAQDLLYRQGLKAMTFAEVAAQVGLNPGSIAYYFKKKEDLAVACFLAAIARLDAIVSEAAEQPDETARIWRFFEAFFAHHRAARAGLESYIPSFGEIRALEYPHRAVVTNAFVAMSRRVRGLFEGPRFAHYDRKGKTALAHVLLEQVFWAIGWLHRYDTEDYPRLLERICDIYFSGIGGAGSDWCGDVLDLPPLLDSDAREDFLIAATRLINRLGYRNASVDRISAELNVTKGSFYHHNEAKDDLAAACFLRSIDIEGRVQWCALEGAGSLWRKLELAVCTLVDFQFSDQGPLAREGLLAGLPDTVRAGLAERLDRVVTRFASMIVDGAADGSMRTVDPLIGAQMLKVMINAAAEAPTWVRGVERAEARVLYARPMLMGVFAGER